MRIVRGVTVLIAGLAMGCAGAPQPRPAPGPTPPAAADHGQTGAAPAKAAVRVVPLPEAGPAPAGWAFVSSDLHELGHPELILIVKRGSAEPSGASEIIETLAAAVKKGRRFRAWEIAEMPEGMLGRPDLTGIALAPYTLDARIAGVSSALVVLLMTKDELAVALHFGVPRVANLLGLRERFFPFPPWFDRTRPSVCDAAQMKESITGQVGARAWLRGASAWQDVHAQPARVVLRLSPSAGRRAARMLGATGDKRLAFFSIAPAADADARLVWTKLGDNHAAINPNEGRADTLAGNFVVLAGGDDSGARVIEDGFALFVPAARWKDLLGALETGSRFEIAGAGDDSPFTIEWAKEEDGDGDGDSAEPASLRPPGAKPATSAAAADDIDLPGDVRFKPAPAAVNDAARRKLQAGFAAPRGKPFASLFEGFTVAGPGLWRWLQKTPGAASFGIPGSFFVPLQAAKTPEGLGPTQQLEGRTYQDDDAVDGLVRLLRGALPAASTPKVRRPTRDEIAILWSMVPFDLEDPLFVVEVGPRHLIVVLSERMTITWIDDLAGASWRAGKGVTWSGGP